MVQFKQAQHISSNLNSHSKESSIRLMSIWQLLAFAYKERLNMPVIAYEVEMQQPEAMREYFKERLQHYRNIALQFPRGTDPVYQKEEGKV